MPESLEDENRRLKRAFQDLEQLYLRDYLCEELENEYGPVHGAILNVIEIIEGVNL